MLRIRACLYGERVPRLTALLTGRANFSHISLENALKRLHATQCSPPNSTSPGHLTCDHTLPPLYSDAVKEGMIHLLVGSYVKSKETESKSWIHYSLMGFEDKCIIFNQEKQFYM